MNYLLGGSTTCMRESLELMFDLSAVFDTIDHDILLSRLCIVYGLTGNALDWFRSYIMGRIHHVVIEDSVSVEQELNFVEFHRVLGLV